MKRRMNVKSGQTNARFTLCNCDLFSTKVSAGDEGAQDLGFQFLYFIGEALQQWTCQDKCRPTSLPYYSASSP